jgi:hypothetical protein
MSRERSAPAVPLPLKPAGYVVSIVSVFLLGGVAWKSASSDPLMLACLIGGMATSITGMLLRWLSYAREQRNAAEHGDLERKR